MQGHAQTLRFTDHRGQLHHLMYSKSGQQGDGFETVRFTSRFTFPLVVSFNATLPVKGMPFAMIISLLLLFKKHWH